MLSKSMRLSKPDSKRLSKPDSKKDRQAAFGKMASRVTDIVDEAVEGPATRKKKAATEEKKREDEFLKTRDPRTRLSVNLGNQPTGPS